jgi:AcrR family transcriptional regulator
MARRSDHSRTELTRMALDAARKIVSEQGLRGLSTRKVADIIGYSPGTLYQLFADQDELVMRMNAETLDGFAGICGEVDFNQSPEATLTDLARRYIADVRERRGLWTAIFEHSLPEGKPQPEWYSNRITTLLGFAARAIAPLFPPGEEAALKHEVQVLWAGLYGIASLATADKLGAGESPEKMVETLARNTLTALRARRQV